jgi:ATP-binding cassette subfamily B multidrug efflux pump
LHPAHRRPRHRRHEARRHRSQDPPPRLRLLLVAALSAVFLYITRQVIIGASREIEFDLRNDLFANLERQSASFYHTHRTGDIMARTTNDLNAVRQLLGPAIMYSAPTAVVFTAAALPFMIHISPKLTLWAVGPLPLASVLVQSFGHRIHRRFERIQAMFSDISAKAQENFSGARLIRAFAQEDAEIASFETANQEYIGRSLHLVRLMAMLWPSLELVLGLSLMITLLVGGHEVVAHRISVGDFAAFNVYMVQLTWPMIAVGWVVNLFQRGTASVVRIDELLKQQPAIADEPSNLVCHSERHPRTPSCDLKLRGDIHRVPHGSTVPQPNLRPPNRPPVSFSYRHQPPQHPRRPAPPSPSSAPPAPANPPSSASSPGSRRSPRPRSSSTASPSATTPRRAPRKHRLRPAGDLPLLRHHRPQHRLRRPDATRGDRRRRTIAHIATEILEFPLGFETLVGERGITLSGGQKQRTAIARAVIRNPRILILDDALASVDTYTEERILSGLREVMRGRTTIFISHRISTARNADQIAVLVAGRIAELGTHDELIARNGYYTALAEKQQLEEELAVATTREAERQTPANPWVP